MTLVVFNMQDARVGGYAPEQVALRRAIVLGDDIGREIRLARYGQAIPAQSILQPATLGYRADLRTEMGDHDPARAKALLDVFGYVDRDGDGWRERPDGSPLLVTLNTQADRTSRQLDEPVEEEQGCDRPEGRAQDRAVAREPEGGAERDVHDVARRVERRVGPTASRAMQLGDSQSIGKYDIARFMLPAYDKVYTRYESSCPTGRYDKAAFDEANRLLLAYVPYRASVHRIVTDMASPQVQGYRRPPFWLGWWQYVDIDPSAGAA